MTACRTPERPVARITAEDGGYRVALRKCRAQRHDTIVGDGSPGSFDAAFSDALLVCNALGADLIITSEAIARFAGASRAFAEAAEQTRLVEISVKGELPSPGDRS